MARRLSLRRLRSEEDGYIAIMTALLMVVMLGMVAFSVDVGRWYLVGNEVQRAADAASLAGVTSLPADPTSAFAKAQQFSTANGYANGGVTTVTSSVGTVPTRLRTTVTTKVNNVFGPLLGLPTTTISRTAVADYAAPVPMGSPCNEFGNDPDPTGYRGSTCAGVNGQFWANVNSPGSTKSNGDAYQSAVCAGDGCAGTTNLDYDPNGYFYTVSVKAAMPSLTIQLFDPAWVNVGLTCGSNFGSSPTRAMDAQNDVVSDEATRYASGPDVAGCTGDNLYGGSGVMNTQFTVRAPSDTNWDPLSFAPVTGCQRVYQGYDGPLFDALNKASAGYRPDVADSFRRWTTLCTIPNPQPGDYLVQVQSNGVGSDGVNAGNRFSIRAFAGSGSSLNDTISISGRQKMGMYSNHPGATTQFYLARVPSGAAGQVLNVRLYDVGDSNQNGTITINAPPDSGVTFTNCQGAGPVAGTLSTCSFTVTSSFNGRWETLSVPIPSTYACVDSDTTKCWVRLTYNYGAGSAPTDVTSWTANLQGDPVRLVE